MAVNIQKICRGVHQLFHIRHLINLVKISVAISTFVFPCAIIAQSEIIRAESNSVTGTEKSGASIFYVDPQSLDINLGIGQPQTTLLHIKNTGNINIEKLIVPSYELLNSATQNRVIAQATEINLNLLPRQEADVPINLPQPVFAGTYVGMLKLTANENSSYTLPITLHTKGPNIINGFAGLPLLLFIVTVSCGLWLSFILEDWFGLGSLRRGQIILNLQQSERHLYRISDGLKQLLPIYASGSLATMKLRLEETLSELRRVTEAVLDTPEERLFNEADRFALSTNKNKLHWDAIQMMIKQYGSDPAKLNELFAKAEHLDANLNLEEYREELQALWNGERSVNKNISIAEKIPPVITPKNLRSRMNGMAWLYRFGIWLVAFILIWEIFFANNFIFGFLLDYLGVFLFTVCFTQTCTQFLSRFRSSFTRAK